MTCVIRLLCAKCISVLTNSSLCSYLFRVTRNQTYASAAILSAEFVWNHLYDGQIILDTISLDDCSINNFGPLSYNSGKFIEGISDIALRNSTWASR